MQADAADQVAEALGRTLVRLSVEVEDLNKALGGPPASGAELWPALALEDGALGTPDEARVIALGLWAEEIEGSTEGEKDGRDEGFATPGDEAHPSAEPQASAGAGIKSPEDTGPPEDNKPPAQAQLPVRARQSDARAPAAARRHAGAKARGRSRAQDDGAEEAPSRE
jgi:hypothetical protein